LLASCAFALGLFGASDRSARVAWASDPATVLDLSVAAACPAGVGDVTQLRNAITTANRTTGGAVIKLASKCVYTLNDAPVADDAYGFNALPPIVNTVVIEGNGATLTRASTAPPFRFFFVNGTIVPTTLLPKPGALTLRNLTLDNGLAQGGAGGSGGYGGGGGAGLGGAIYAQGDLTLNGVLLHANVARGGDGGSVTTGAGAGGGGLGGHGGKGGSSGGGGSGGNGGDCTVAGSGGGGWEGDGVDGIFSAIRSTGGAPGGPTPAAGAGTDGSAGSGGSGGDVVPRISFGNGSDGAFGGGGGGGGNAGGNGGVGGGGGGASYIKPTGSTASGAGGAGGFGGGGGGGGVSGGMGGFGGGGGGGPTTNAFGGWGGGAAGNGPGGPGAGAGGALFIEAGTATITNTTFSKSAAYGGKPGTGGTTAAGFSMTYGADVCVYGGKASFEGVTFNESTASSDGTKQDGFVVASIGGNLSYGHTIFAAGSYLDWCFGGGGTQTSNGYNLIATNTPRLGTCTLSATDQRPADAKLAPLADNGGPTKTYAIAASSPAYGIGPCTLTTDQRGLPRPAPSACDAGAFELTQTVTVTLAGSGSGTVTSTNTVPLLSCPGTCAGYWKPVLAPNLAATPAAGSTFDGFSGYGTSNPVTLLGSTDVSVTATFSLPVVDAGPEASVDAGSDATGATGADAADDASEVGGSADAIASTSADAADAADGGNKTPVIVGIYTTCKSTADCGGGPCVDGVCCDSACTGTCMACNLPTAPGKCSPVPYGNDPRGSCGALGTCSQTCDGRGACVPAATGAACQAAACTGPSTDRRRAR
jgi:hypothetical protein